MLLWVFPRCLKVRALKWLKWWLTWWVLVMLMVKVGASLLG